MALVAFICEVPRPFEGVPKFRAWAAPRCRGVNVVEGTTTTRLSGILLRSPGNQRKFQSLWANNLRNWGLPRLTYQRGAVRLVTLAQYKAEIGPTENALAVCSKLVEDLVNTAVAYSDRRAKEREEAEAKRLRDARVKADQTPEGKAQLAAQLRAELDKNEAHLKAYLERSNAEIKARKEERDALKRERAAMAAADSEACDLRKYHVRPRTG